MKLITSPTLGMLDTRYMQGAGVIGQLAEFVTNTKTLQAARILSNVTAGKVLTLTATDDYNLTIPATGTAALLGVANVFTTQQMIDGTSDQIQLRVQRHSTQTANLQTWESSAGAVLGYINGIGALKINATAPTGVNSNAGEFNQYSSGATATTTLRGLLGAAYSNGTGTVTTLEGMNFTLGSLANGNITNANILKIQTYGAGTGIISYLNGISIGNLNAYNTPIETVGITFAANTTVNGDKKCAIYINDISGATTSNRAIVTNAGDIVFNNSGAALADFTWKTDSYNGIFGDASNESLVLMSNAAGKLGFYGATAIVQPSGATQAAPATYVTGAFGLDSDAHMQALYDLVVAMRTALVNLGIMKGAA